MPDYTLDYVLRLILHRLASFCLKQMLMMLLTVFSVFKFIFHCLADIMAGLRAKTSAGLYTRLCAEANFT